MAHIPRAFRLRDASVCVFLWSTLRLACSQDPPPLPPEEGESLPYPYRLERSNHPRGPSGQPFRGSRYPSVLPAPLRRPSANPGGPLYFPRFFIPRVALLVLFAVAPIFDVPVPASVFAALVPISLLDLPRFCGQFMAVTSSPELGDSRWTYSLPQDRWIGYRWRGYLSLWLSAPASTGHPSGRPGSPWPRRLFGLRRHKSAEPKLPHGLNRPRSQRSPAPFSSPQTARS